MKSRLISRVPAAGVASAAALLMLAACGQDARLAEPPEEPESKASIVVTPEDGGGEVPVSAEIAVSVEEGELDSLTVTDAAGEAVSGQWRADNSSWVPDEPLNYESEYLVEAVAVDEADLAATTETSFTTMAEPSNRASVRLFNSDSYEYGKAMPIVLNFNDGYEVPEEYRAQVERRLFVESDPPQAGVWHWFTPRHLEYRPENYWEPGTEITMRLALGGLPVGDDVYGSKDVRHSMTISGVDREIEVSDDDKAMRAIEDGETIKSVDVSLGKDSTPSYSGTMIVMTKESETVFDTTDKPECGGKEDGEDCYKLDIDWAMRLTWSGQFIHSAPWSVGDQGVRNVSHGCVNASAGNAEWIFNFAAVGTPVVVTGTGVSLPYGDGFTAYDMSWEDFKAGSYLEGGEADEE